MFAAFWAASKLVSDDLQQRKFPLSPRAQYFGNRSMKRVFVGAGLI
jgi:hypothetical protein